MILYWNAPAGGSSTDPGIANVRLSTSYTISGSSLTGTLDLPAQSDVKNGVSYDNGSQTGSYNPNGDLLTTALFLALKDS